MKLYTQENSGLETWTQYKVLNLKEIQMEFLSKCELLGLLFKRNVLIAQDDGWGLRVTSLCEQENAGWSLHEGQCFETNQVGNSVVL